jgi:hypothetical protein
MSNTSNSNTVPPLQNRFRIVEKWTKIDLNSKDPFDINKRYRVDLIGDKSQVWYPVIVGTNGLGLEVSSAAFVFGWITNDNKKEWHYRQKGNSAKRPPGYENQNWKVNTIEFAEFELIIEIPLSVENQVYL